MKTALSFLFTFLFCCILSACQSIPEKISPSHIRGTWQLEQYYSIETNLYYPATSLPYLEYYDFSEDGTFRKYRSNGIETGGTYTIKPYQEAYYADLKYFSETDPGKIQLQWACNYQELTLKPSTANSLEQDNTPCDGPRYYYQKIR
jgi:hypothetical protein